MQCRPAVLDLERGLDPAGLLARERPTHELAEELRESRPRNPVARPATGRVRGPGDAATEAVLPLRQEWIVPGSNKNGLGRGLDRRAVVAEQLREPIVEAPQDRRGTGLDGEEGLFDDLLPRDLFGFLEEDVRDRSRVGRGVEPTAALLRQLLEERVGPAAGPDRRECDPRGLHALDDLVVLARFGPAVGQEDDVPAGRGGLLERTDRLVEAGEDVGRPVRVDPGDESLQVRGLPERLCLDDPVSRIVERHDTEFIARGQGCGRSQDGLLADIDLAHPLELAAAALPSRERVAVAGVHRAGLIDDHDECHVRLLLAIADAHVDG